MASNQPQGIAATKGAIRNGKGIERGNPKRCLYCRRLIRRGQPWGLRFSPADPVYGRYAVIVHTDCDKAQKGGK